MAQVNYVQPNALSDYSLWLGVPNLSEALIKQFDPAYTGHVHIFLIRAPRIFTEFYPQHAANLKAVLERASTSFTGLPELTLNFQDQTHGFNDRRVPHATNSEMSFDQATIRCLEFKGLPVYNMIREWIENVSDPISKIQDYKGRASAGQIEYALQNHSASFIVCTSDPTHTKLQGRAHYITAAVPVSITNEHFNWNSGEISIVEGHDIAFRGVLRWGNYVDQKAYELLMARRTLVNWMADGSEGRGTPLNPYVTL